MRSDRQPALPMPDARLADAFRVAADTAAHDPYFTPAQRIERAAYYTAQAERLAGDEHVTND